LLAKEDSVITGATKTDQLVQNVAVSRTVFSNDEIKDLEVEVFGR
jgi:hypothetical protein